MAETAEVLIDGSSGEGGGQMLRSAVALSMLTGRAFRMENVRARREKPGLRAQHLAAVLAAQEISGAEVTGAHVGSQQLSFRPGPVKPGEYAFDVGTAGSATLVLQTILPALMLAPESSAIRLEGGTHNSLAPPFEFLERTFLPVLERMGPRVQLKLDRHGFHPAGGGKIRASIQPVSKLTPIDLIQRGDIESIRATAVLANLPALIGERELKVLKRDLHLDARDLHIHEVPSYGPGNVLFAEVRTASVTEVLCSFGERGVRSEAVASRLVDEVKRFVAADVPVGEHLADQLLLPMALVRGGSFRALPLSMHARTQMDLIRLFLPVEFNVEPDGERAVRVSCVEKD